MLVILAQQKQKKKDLIKLCEDDSIPSKYHKFYESIPIRAVDFDSETYESEYETERDEKAQLVGLCKKGMRDTNFIIMDV